MNILDYIPYGKENAIKRYELKNQTGLSDRLIRKLIAEARLDDVIINLQDGGGYYRPTCKAEFERYLRQETRRGKSVFYRLKAARRALNEVN